MKPDRKVLLSGRNILFRSLHLICAAKVTIFMTKVQIILTYYFTHIGAKFSWNIIVYALKRIPISREDVNLPHAHIRLHTHRHPDLNIRVDNKGYFEITL